MGAKQSLINIVLVICLGLGTDILARNSDKSLLHLVDQSRRSDSNSTHSQRVPADDDDDTGYSSARSRLRNRIVRENYYANEDDIDDEDYGDEDNDNEDYEDEVNMSPRVLGPAMRYDDPNFLSTAANNSNFNGTAAPGGSIKISDGSKNDTCILVDGIADAAMGMFRSTFKMAGAMYQNVHGADSIIAAVQNCANAMGGWVPNLVISTHGYSRGYTAVGLQTSGQGLSKFIAAMTQRNIGFGRIRFLSCLVARGVDQNQQQHMMKQMALGLPGPPRRPGDTSIAPGPEVTAWDQVIWAGVGTISSQGRKWTISARNMNPEREIELARQGYFDRNSNSNSNTNQGGSDWQQQGGYSQEQQWSQQNGLWQPQGFGQYRQASMYPSFRRDR